MDENSLIASQPTSPKFVDASPADPSRAADLALVDALRSPLGPGISCGLAVVVGRRVRYCSLSDLERTRRPPTAPSCRTARLDSLRSSPAPAILRPWWSTNGELSDDDSVHHANIIRGKAHLAIGDAAASQAALLAAGDVQGSPALNSFGPDLSLAWNLMRAGHDDAVIGYLRLISRFWSPRDAIGVRSHEPTE